MPHYGLLTGTDDDGVDGSWLVELEDDGTPRDDFVLIPVKLMPGVVLV